MAKRSGVELDRLIGARLRAVRRDREMSQEELGRLIGVTFQQVQKYERGKNRIAASRLCLIAAIFRLPVTFFLEPGAEERRMANSE